MTDSYRSELHALIEQVYFGEFGGRATSQMVHGAAWAVMPEALSDYLIGKGLASEVQSYFRAKGAEGLPRFPEVNDSGEHVQLELLSLDEFTFVHRKYVDRAEANTSQAQKVRELCLTVHGVDLAQVGAA